MNKKIILALAILGIALVVFFIFRGCKEKTVTTETIELIHDDSTHTATVEPADTLEGNPQLADFLLMVDSLTMLKSDVTRIRKGRNECLSELGSYKRLYLALRDSFVTFKNGGCDDKLRLMTDQYLSLSRELESRLSDLTMVESSFEELSGKHETLVEQLNIKYINPIRDTTEFGILDGEAITDGFVLRPGMFTYSYHAYQKTITESDKNRPFKKNSYAALIGLRPGGEFVYSLLYHRNARLAYLYVQPAYYGGSKLGFGGFDANNFGLSLGLGVNMK